MKFSANIRKVSLISDKTYLFLVFITYRWYHFNDIITKKIKIWRFANSHLDDDKSILPLFMLLVIINASLYVFLHGFAGEAGTRNAIYLDSSCLAGFHAIPFVEQTLFYFIEVVGSLLIGKRLDFYNFSMLPAIPILSMAAKINVLFFIVFRMLSSWYPTYLLAAPARQDNR